MLEADSGEAALVCTVEHAVHLVLLDVQMPGMDGFETARHLGMTERTRHIPVVFVTAVFKADEFVARGYELGAVDYLTKPIDDNLLLSRIRLYMHLRERELNLEAAVNLLVKNEESLLVAKENAESLARELAANTAKLRKLNQATEQSPNSLFITDPRGVIEYVNPKFVEHTGYSAVDAIGKRPSLFKSGKTPAATYQELWATITSGNVWRGELMNRKKDGSFYWVSASIAPVRDENGVVSHFVGNHADITEKVQALENLRNAKESAERANRAKSVFLANMSHELRTPLNAILGFARLLGRDAGMNDDSRRKLATIDRSGQHLLALINDVLEISRIEAGRSELREVVFDLGELLREIEDMIRLRAEQKGLSLEVDRDAGLPVRVRGDAHHLRQILINLLGNAVKYTDTGQVRLRVAPVAEPGVDPDAVTVGADATARTGASGGRIRFDVVDTGPGIAREDQERIFQAFYQTEGGIAKGEGTGLGLAISHEYARLMGGELGVESQPGQGSRFTLSAPLAAAEEETPILEARHGAVIGLAPGIAAPRILVADDKADNSELILELLKPVGFEVKGVSDGRQALDAFAQWHPALILMDLRMPVMDGYEATRRIRALPGGEAVKIVALTASAFEEDRAVVLAAGCDMMVTKPVEEERLFAVIGDLLGLDYRRGELVADAGTPLSAEGLDMGSLPADIRAELRTASEALDLNRVRQIVARLRAEEPEISRMLDSLTSSFRFDRIVELCDGGGLPRREADGGGA